MPETTVSCPTCQTDNAPNERNCAAHFAGNAEAIRRCTPSAERGQG